MNQELIHVYLLPGMAANPKIFEYIKWPKNQFKIHLLEWILPLNKESISDYAFRLCKKIQHEDVVLLGVSFGGIVVQEMSKHIKVRKLVIVSSIKRTKELPKKMCFAKKTKSYLLIPTQLPNKIYGFKKYALGKNIKKRLSLYNKYLSFNDRRYLSWAIKEMVCWEQNYVIPNIIHIHGDEDAVFPVKYIKNYINIKGGTHIAIVNKHRWFSENLPELILGK